MSQYKYLVKLFLKNILRPAKKEKKSGIIAMLIAFALTYLMIGISFLTSIVRYTKITLENGFFNEFIACIILVTFFIIMFFGISTIITQLYFGKDTEFLSSLPISAQTIFISKFTVVYLEELLLAILVMLPSVITAGILASMSFLYYIVMVLAIVVLPIIPLGIASILAIPIMYLVSFFKNRGAFSSLAYILLFAIVFVIYYVMITLTQNLEFNTEDSERIASILNLIKIISMVAYPFLAIVRAATKTPVFFNSVALSSILNILIYLATALIFLFLSVFISKFIYSRGIAAQLEQNREKVKKGNYKLNSPFKTYLKKEWKMLIRTPVFSFQSLMGMILCPIVVTIMMFTGITGSPDETATEMEKIIFDLMPVLMGIFMILLIGAMNIGAASCFSMEGEYILLTKSLPIPNKIIVKTKFVLYLMIGILSGFISLIIIAIITKQWIFCLLFFIYYILHEAFIVIISMLIDMKNPKLKWVNPNEAVKQNKTVLTSTLITMGYGLLAMGFFLVLYFTVMSLLSPTAALLTFIIMYLIGGVIFGLSYWVLNQKTDSYLERMEI